MAIDWTKPIRQKNGRALRFLHELQNASAKYTMVCVVTQEDGNEYVVTYTKDGLYNRDNKRGSPNDVENIPATAEAQPEIDWAGEVQYRLPSRDEWQDIQIVGGPVNECVWVCCDNDIPKTLLIGAVYWRNKPAEPKRVKGFVNIYHDYVYQTRTEACRAASDFRIACIEIDLHEGEGLEEVK